MVQKMELPHAPDAEAPMPKHFINVAPRGPARLGAGFILITVQVKNCTYLLYSVFESFEYNAA